MKRIILFFCLISLFTTVSNAQTDVINIIPGGNVGISSTAPLSSLEVSGSYGQKVTTITANTPLDGTHNTVVCNNGATAITVTLPTASTATGRVYVIKRNAASAANVTVTGNPTLDGVGNYVLTMPNQSIEVFSDGAEWKTRVGGLSGNSTAWGLSGNSGTTASTSPIGTAANNNFIGTADAKDFVMAANGLERMRITSGGNIGIGTIAPGFKMEVRNTSVGHAAYIRSDATTGTNYGVDAEAMGVGAGTNIGGYFAASGATNNYAIIVPSGFGNVGIGNIAPNSFKVQVAGDVGPNADLMYNLGSASLRWNNLYVNSIQGPGALWTRSGTTLYNTNTGDNVGIGVATPQKLLDVISPANDYITVGANTLSPGQWAGIHFGYRENNLLYRKSAMVFERTDGGGGGGNAAGKIHFLNGPAVGSGSATLADAKVTIAETGNMGIGTTAPSTGLTIVRDNASLGLQMVNNTMHNEILFKNASGSNLADILSSGSSTTYGAENGGLAFFTGSSFGAPKMTIKSGGNVGINSTGPTQKLDVAGNVNAQHILNGPLVARPKATWSVAGASTGAVIIKLPAFYPANHGMLHMEINVYEYDGNGVTTYIIGGHNWGNQWYNYNCHTIGVSTKKIRLVVKDGQYAVVIGEQGSTWSYGHVVLSKITNGEYYVTNMDLSGAYTVYQDNAAESYTWASADLNRNLLEAGSGSTNYLARWTSPTTLGIGVSYDNGTNVGIGMGAGAISKLHTSGTLTVGPNATANAVGNIQITTGGSSPVSNRLVYGTDGSGWKFSIGKNQGGTVTDQLTIQDNGLTGIGTSSPAYALDVTSTVANSSRIYIHPSTGTEYALLQFSNNGGTSYFGMDNSGGSGLGSGTAYALTTYAAGTVPITMATNGSERMRIISSGNVGIGSTSPATKLDVSGGSVRTTNQLISTVATGTAPLDVSSTTNVTNLNADLLDGRHARELQFMQSDRDFPNGTLIKTDIVYGDYGEPWLLEIEGNSYGNLIPIDIKIQGYIYPAPYMYNVAGISNGTNITGLSAFNFGGNLCFWFPTQGYWNGYSVFVNDSYAGVKHNRLVSITHEAKPVAITKEVELSSLIRQSVHSGNISSNAIQNQYSSAQSANFWISGIANVENEYRLDNVAAITGSGTDVYANIRVIRNLSTVNTDGMYIGYNGSGGPLRFYANSGTTEHMTLNTDGNLVFNDYGKGVVGTYSDVRYQGVFSMGNAYRLSTDGTSVGNLYGIAWTHSNIGGQSKSGLSHQALFMSAGVTQTAIGTGIWTLGNLTAPIMYDYNDGNYYCDPNGTTRLNKLLANCNICLYWADNDASWTTSTQKRCVSMTSNATNNISSFVDFSGDMDGNDRMWIGFECP